MSETKKNFMENLVDKIATALTPVANKIANIKFLQALTKTFQAVIPITMIGAFACLFAWIPINVWQEFLAAHTRVLYTFYTIQSLTLSIIALYVLIFLSYLYAKTLEIKNPIIVVPVTVASFLMITPTELFASIPSQWLGYSGMFSAFIVTWVSVRLVKLCLDKRIIIRMPRGVPEFVEAAFAIFIPAAISIALFAVVGILMSGTSYGSLHQFIYTMLQAPLANVTDSYLGLLLSYTVSSLACFCGIHAESVTPHISMFVLTFDAENLAAYSAGLPLPHVFSTAVSSNIYIGGMGATLGLGVLLCLVAKSQRYKKLSRVAIVPQVFNIAEPLLFGLPIMLNPIAFIPYILTIMVNTTIAYWVVASGIFARAVSVSMSWTVPVVIQSALNFAKPWQGVLLNLTIMAIDMLIWYPFVKVLDRKALAEENASESL
ncbi:MAG: PTS transporter subunit EIIC [Erysipelotrichia bacterium]|nr:PTS transporter subunit EIIC [Erysipelotrichia bacterium]